MTHSYFRLLTLDHTERQQLLRCQIWLALAALEVFVSTGATNDDRIGVMVTTLSIQRPKSYHDAIFVVIAMSPAMINLASGQLSFFNVYNLNLLSNFKMLVSPNTFSMHYCLHMKYGDFKYLGMFSKQNKIKIFTFIYLYGPMDESITVQWNLSITTTWWDTSLPSGAHLAGQGPPRWAPEGRNC